MHGVLYQSLGIYKLTRTVIISPPHKRLSCALATYTVYIHAYYSDKGHEIRACYVYYIGLVTEIYDDKGCKEVVL